MSDSELMLARMRLGTQRLKVMLFEIEEAGLLLRDGKVSAFGAVLMLRDAGLDELCGVPAVGTETAFAAGLLENEEVA